MRSIFKYIPCIFLACGIAADSYSAGLTFNGSSLRVLELTPDRQTGLDKIYVCYDTSGVDLVYKTSTPTAVKIYRYSNLGGAFSEEITGLEYNSGEVVMKNLQGDMGYIVEVGDKREYYWVVNYLPHRFSINSVMPAEEQDCDAMILNVDGSGAPIYYYTINGQQKVLSRDIHVEYETQEWDESSNEYVRIPATKIYDSMSDQMRITPAAYCATSFHVSGDVFLEQWNWLASAESAVVNPVAVSVHTEAIREDESTGASGGDGNAAEDEGEVQGDGETEGSDGSEDGDSVGSNQIKGDDSGLGGSAPAHIEFRAYTTEGVIHHEWQMSKDPEFEKVDYRFNSQDLDYTFNDEGTFYLRYIGSNSDGTCESVGDTYTVSIGASELLCPNAFSPDGDGVNDEWKVSYRSILEFKCWIFDRYGAQLCYFDDPSMGWDGKRGDKTVKPGVYYYVIQALGADGKKYKLSGDINILRHRMVENSVAE